MSRSQSEHFLETLRFWCRGQCDITAVAKVGSYARGDPRPDSDIDIVLICEDPKARHLHREWIAEFGEATTIRHADYGLVQSLHIDFRDYGKVEFGLTNLEWLTPPIDEKTKDVMRGGIVSVFDPKRLIDRVLRSLDQSGSS